MNFTMKTKEIEEHLMSYKDLDKWLEDRPTSRKKNICDRNNISSRVNTQQDKW